MIYHKKWIEWSRFDEEIGDVLWYIQAYCTLRGKTVEELMEMNMEKLKNRYPTGFTPGGGIRE